MKRSERNLEERQNKTFPLQKITMAAFCASVIILFLTYAASRCLIIQVETNNFMEDLEVQTKESLSFAKYLFDDMVEDLKHTAYTLQNYDDLQQTVAKEALALSQYLNFYDATFISDTAGNAYAYDGSEFSIADQRFFQDAVKSQGFTFSEILPSRRFGAIQIISLPLYSNLDPQEIRGYLFGLYEIQRFSQSMDTVLDNDQYLYIVDSNGIYINTFVEHQEISSTQNFWDDFSLVEMNGITIEELRHDFDQQTEGSFSYSYNEIQRYGYHMPLGIKDWQIVFSMEESIIDSHVQGLSQIATTASIINWTCLAIMLWSVYHYFKTVNKTIRSAHERISKTNEMMRIAVESSDRVIFEYNIQERTVDLKTKLPHHLFNHTATSEVPDSFINMNTVAECSVADLRNLFQQIETESHSQADIQLISGAKDPVWYRIRLKNIYGAHRKIISTVGSAEDISLLKQGEAAIKRKEEIHKTLINTSLLYARVDLNAGVIHELNGEKTDQSYCEYLEGTIPQYVCKEYHSYVTQALSLETLREAYHQGTEHLDVQFQRKTNQENRWTSILIYRVHENEGINAVLVVRDIDEQKRAELALKEQAEFDGLTKLYNAATTRSKIRELLSLPHTEQEKQILILLDLDHFKKVNDTFGHATGDQVLVDAANQLKTHFRATDIVGRLGGDEFVVMLCDVKSDLYIDIIAGSLRPELARTYTQGDVSVTVSASMGIVVFPDDGITLEELCQKADTALYQVKKSGGNGYLRWTE